MNTITDTEWKAIDQLRNRGFAVVVFEPKELAGVNADDVESRMIEVGWDFIAYEKEYL